MASLSSLVTGAPSLAMGRLALTASSGTQAVTGVGFKPTWIYFYGCFDNAASTQTGMIGLDNGASEISHGKVIFGSTPTYLNDQNVARSYSLYRNLTDLVSGSIQSFDSDGFTITKDDYDFTADLYWIAGR